MHAAKKHQKLLLLPPSHSLLSLSHHILPFQLTAIRQVAKWMAHQRNGNIIKHYCKTLSAPAHTLNSAYIKILQMTTLINVLAQSHTHTNLSFIRLEIEFWLNNETSLLFSPKCERVDKMRLASTQIPFTIWLI